MADLKPANDNPWYILMTLYGEQEGDQVDWGLHEKNKAVWNAWSCQNLSNEERATLKEAGANLPELGAWKRIEAEVEAQLAKRARHLDFGSLPDVADQIDCSRIEFAQVFVLSGFIFTGAIKFGSAKFTRRTLFSDTVFAKDAYFRSAVFEGPLYSVGATFRGVALFEDATFMQRASFEAMTFSGLAYFTSTKFMMTAGFFATKFQDRAFFREAEFGIEGVRDHGLLDLRDAQFDKPASFRDAKFHARYPDFTGTILDDKTIFPSEAANWPPKNCAQNPKAGRDSCAFLRHHVTKQGLPEQAHFFFRREMGFAQKTGLRRTRLLYWLFGILSNYGHSIMRPALALFVVWIAGFVLFQGCTASDVFCVIGPPAARELSSWDALGLSFSNMFGFFGFQRLYFLDVLKEFPVALKVVAGAQTVLSFVFLFFLGLGLRQRFRLR